MESKSERTLKKGVLYFSLFLLFAGVAFSEEPAPTYQTNLSSGTTLEIVREPPAGDFGRGALEKLPKFDPQSSENWQVDLRGYDVTKLDIRDKIEELLNADFDSKTKWPTEFPAGFDPKKIMETAKNPGLHLRSLHEKGITGKDIGIGIIDQALLVTHNEYKNQLRLYEEIHLFPKDAQMHGPAVSSIAVGKNVGVAPGADLYYIAETHTTPRDKNGKWDWDIQWIAKSIDRLIEVNKGLPKQKKIRVISISLGVNPSMKGYDAVKKALEEAKKNDIYVVYVDSNPFFGLGRAPLADPDQFESYRRGEFWKTNAYTNQELLIPMDSRTTASPTGNDDYVFYRNGGMSWTVPYVAGMYALACQVKPDITPEKFWEGAMKTAITIKVQGEKYPELGKILNPTAFMEELQKQK